MDKQFWMDRWEANEIGFHESEANALLKEYLAVLNLETGARICVPLCGKTRDIAWLLAQGYRVLGIELAETAIIQLFEELGAKPSVSVQGTHKRYSAEGIDILVGDIFELVSDDIGLVDAVYDRAAYVALPPAMRKSYVSHIAHICLHKPQLLISFEYDQSKIPGPPFSHSREELMLDYHAHYDVHCLDERDVSGGLRGVAAKELVWSLHSIKEGR